MNAIKNIRINIFTTTQAQFAVIAGTTQASVSRWETGEQSPDQTEMARIRAAARKRKIRWDDSWFFEPPVREPRAAVEQAARGQ